MGKFERDLEGLRLKRQSLVVCDASAGYHLGAKITPQENAQPTTQTDYKTTEVANNYDMRRSLIHPLGIHDALEEEE